MRNNIEYRVWLGSIPGIGIVKSKTLLEYFEEPYNFFRAKQIDL